MIAINQDNSLHNKSEFDYSKKIEIRKLNIDAPMRWLSKGIEDYKVSPLVSLSFGILYTLIGLLLIWLTYENPVYTFGMVTVFYLIGPVIAVGLYCMSRHIEAGVKPSFSQGCRAMLFNSMGIAGFSIVIGILIVFWVVVALSLSAVYLDGMTISDGIYETLLANKQLLPFAGLMVLVGLFFAVISFSISVISIPLMMHRKVDVVTAISTSVRAVKKNPVIMLVWAFAIVALIALGFALAFVGVAIMLPIVGHASWHAYRELVVDNEILTVDD